MERNILTPGRLIPMLLCARCFAVMTSYPSAYKSPVSFMVGIALSGALQLLLLLPLVLLGECHPGKSPCTLAFSAGRKRGAAVTLLYLGYFLYEAFIDVGNFTYFLDHYFTGDLPRLLTVLSFAGAALYLGRLSSGAIGRCAQYVLGGIVLLMLLLCVGARNELDTLNLYIRPQDGTGTVMAAVRGDLARCECFVLLAFLMGDIDTAGDSTLPAKTAGAYTLLKTLLLELIFGLIALVLGDHALVTKQPFYALSSATGTSLIERLDAPFMLVWIMTGTLKLGVLIHCIGRCLRLLRPGLTMLVGGFAGTICVCGAALAVLLPRRWERFAYNDYVMWWVVLLSMAIPLIMLIAFRRRDKDVSLSPTPEA